MKQSCGKVLHTQNSILNAISMYCVTAIHSPYLIPVLSIRTILVYQNIARPHSVFGTQTNNCLVCFALSPRATTVSKQSQNTRYISSSLSIYHNLLSRDDHIICQRVNFVKPIHLQVLWVGNYVTYYDLVSLVIFIPLIF